MLAAKQQNLKYRFAATKNKVSKQGHLVNNPTLLVHHTHLPLQ